MNSTIQTVGRVLRGGPWQQPRFRQPIVMEVRQLEPLGKHSGAEWWYWPELKCEVEQVGELLDVNDRAVPDGPLIRVRGTDGDLRLQPLRTHAPGTFAARTTVVPRALRAPAPQRPLDFLDGNTLLTGHTQSGRFAIRGTDPIMDRYRAKLGVEFYPGADPFAFEFTAPGGRLVTAFRRDLQDLAPLLAPKINTGVAPGCDYPNHSGYVEARSLREASPAPKPWCGECGGPS